MKEKSSNKIIVYNMVGKFIFNGINFLMVPIFTRMLGTDNFGLFSLYLTWENILLIIVGLQSQSIIGNISIKYTKKERMKILSSNTFLCFLISCFIGIFFLFFRESISVFLALPSGILPFMLVHAYANYGVNVITGLWSFDKDAEKNFFASLALSLINIALSIWFIKMIQNYEDKYIGRVVGSALPTILFGGVSIVYILVRGKTLYKKEYWKYTVTFAIPIMFHALSNVVLSQSDRIMLQRMSTLREVGVYSVIFTLTNVLSILMDAFNTAWVPFFYEDLEQQKKSDVLRKSKNYIWVFTCITIGFLLVAPEVLGLYAGGEYREYAKSLPFLALGCFFVFLYSFSVNYKYYKGNTVSIAIGTVSAGLCNIGLNYLLIPTMGIYGASLATMISYMALCFFHHVGAKQIEKEQYPYTVDFFLPNLLCVSLTAVGAYTIFFEMIILRWILAITVGFILMYSVFRRKSIW